MKAELSKALAEGDNRKAISELYTLFNFRYGRNDDPCSAVSLGPSVKKLKRLAESKASVLGKGPVPIAYVLAVANADFCGRLLGFVRDELKSRSRGKKKPRQSSAFRFVKVFGESTSLEAFVQDVGKVLLDEMSTDAERSRLSLSLLRYSQQVLRSLEHLLSHFALEDKALAGLSAIASPLRGALEVNETLVRENELEDLVSQEISKHLGIQ